MNALADRSLPEIASALRDGSLSASDLAEAAIASHRDREDHLGAYKHFDEDRARAMAARADAMLRKEDGPGPLCGIPISVKDLYGVRGLPTFAGTRRALPERWQEEGWLVSRLRAQGAVFTGKTHTSELAYSGVGTNPHWGTPRNPWDEREHRIPGGSSAGAGVSLCEGSALVALGTDTGGSIRIPASMTGNVGPRFTHGRWPTTGVVPLSPSMDTVGALTRSVEDAAYFFGALDPAWAERTRENPMALRAHLDEIGSTFRVGLPAGRIWDRCQEDVAGVIHDALAVLVDAGWQRRTSDGALLDSAVAHYMGGKVVSAECRTFLGEALPDWIDLLDPTVATRIAGSPLTDSDAYRASLAERERLMGEAASLFEGVDLLVLPGALTTPPRVRELNDLGAYLEANATALQPTCPVSMLGLCALVLPVGRDREGLPVGLQFVAPAGSDELLLAASLSAERILGS